MRENFHEVTVFSTSSLARSPDTRRLLEFAESSGLMSGWLDPKSLGVTACVTGNTLDQAVGSNMLDGDEANLEMLVHLESPKGKCTINLVIILALATAYIAEQYSKIEEWLPKPEGQ